MGMPSGIIPMSTPTACQHPSDYWVAGHAAMGMMTAGTGSAGYHESLGMGGSVVEGLGPISLIGLCESPWLWEALPLEPPISRVSWYPALPVPTVIRPSAAQPVCIERSTATCPEQ